MSILPEGSVFRKMKLASLLNDNLLSLFNLRVVRASSWRAQQDHNKQHEALAGSSEARERLLQLTRFLLPVRAIGHEKIRLGDPNDGGYVCLDDLKGIKAAFSFGIAENVTWDLEVADRGISVYQLDHSVDGPPQAHENFHFQKARVVASAREPYLAEESISTLLTRHADRNIASILLKIDVEHDEWDIFASANQADLRVFSQVICEFHGFDYLLDCAWYKRALGVLERFDLDFAVVHVHANNCRPLLVIGNIPFPEVLEVTFANRAKYRFEPTTENFPASLDAPNDRSRPDIPLNYVYLHRYAAFSRD